MPEAPKKLILETLTAHLQNSPLTVVEWDHNFRVTFWSGQAEQIFGWREEELLGKHPSDWRFMHEEDEAAISKVMRNLVSGGVPRNISKNRNYTRDGQVLHCEWYNSVLTDASGTVVSVLSLVQDVTGKVTMEEQLRQLQKMEAIGQLTGGIAHDFNNLLTVILGNGELLTEMLEDQPDMAVLADTVTNAARKGADLTHQLLAFARQQPLQPQAIDVNALLETTRDLLRRTLGEHIELTLGLGKDLPPALVDTGQLESAILNLCLNARDAMSESGHLTIESSFVHLDQDYADRHTEVTPGGYVLVAISDTGEGIPPDRLEKVFEPFFSTKGPGKGSGLGLSMVFGFVKQSRGHIKIYSEVGEGTTVRMYLPPSPESAPPATRRPPANPKAGTETILLVEDDELVRQYASTQLSMLGYRVMVASNGLEAMDIVNQHDDIDLLFTDVVMPGGINGPTLARQACERRPRLKVLYTSGYTQNAIVHHGRLDAGVLLLSKPYHRAELARMVRQALDTA